ncbi:MAG: ROK family protein, partial [Nitrosopumilus sp.]|nr:ROK family protein [Nitrosopumilus sp.]
MYKIGVDLGGTKTEIIVLDENLNVIERKRVPTPQNNYDEIIHTIINLVSDVSQSISDFSLGVCCPGAISKQTGVIKNSNTQCLIGKSLKEDLENKLQKNISIENDANCFTIAESKLGAGIGFDLVFGVIMGTGVGGGIVIDNTLHSGRTNIAGEWGHHTLHQNGNSCYCGKNGCVETYISGPSLEKRWNQLTGLTQTMPEIIENFDNSIGKQWKNEFLENFGHGLANVIDILDPDAIILGGGLSNIDFLYHEGKESIYSKVFSDMIETPILKNNLGDSSGVFG